MHRFLAGDSPTPPSFTGYRCDTPGRSGQRAPKSTWVAAQPIYLHLARDFRPATVLHHLASAQTPSDREHIGKIAIERTFELVRPEVDPRLPSRLSSIFLYDDSSWAALFRRDFQPDCVIYSCRVTGWWFRGEANKITSRLFSDAPLSISGVKRAMKNARAAAFAYWSSEFEAPTFRELLVDGEATFIQELSDVPLPANAAPPPPWVTQG